VSEPGFQPFPDLSPAELAEWRQLADVAIRDGENWNDRRLPEIGRVLHTALDRLEAAERDANEIAREANAETVRLARLRRAAWSAMRELGVPDRNYPAPVANAYRILNEALAARDSGE